MTFAFSDDAPTAERARAVTDRLLDRFDAVAGASGGVSVAVQHAEIFPVLYGWWRFATRTARALRVLDRAGFTVEAYALLRNLILHVHGMAWLVDAGTAGLRALEEDTYIQRTKLLNEATAQNWNAVRDASAPSAPDLQFADEADRKLHRTLLGQLQHDGNLFPALAAADMYTVYRLLSGYAHFSAHSANAFLHRDADGTARLRLLAPDGDDSYARPIWTAVSLLHAGAIISPLLDGDPLRGDLECAAHELGLPLDLFAPPAP